MRTNKRPGGIIQFPLCALSYGRTFKDRCNAIFDYVAVEKGQIMWSRLPEKERQSFRANLQARSDLPRGFRPSESRHCAVLYGASLMHVRHHDMGGLLEGHRTLSEFRDRLARSHGRDPEVRLKTDLLIEARDGSGIKPHEFAVLSAIYSVIGNKEGPVRITQETIGLRALGYKTKAVFTVELPCRQDGIKPLSDWQLRQTIRELHLRRFFARVTYGRRQTYYARRMAEARLRQAVVGLKTHRFEASYLARLHDDQMTKIIRNQRAEFQGHPLPEPDALPLPVPAGTAGSGPFAHDQDETLQ